VGQQHIFRQLVRRSQHAYQTGNDAVNYVEVLSVMHWYWRTWWPECCDDLTTI